MWYLYSLMLFSSDDHVFKRDKTPLCYKSFINMTRLMFALFLNLTYSVGEGYEYCHAWEISLLLTYGRWNETFERIVQDAGISGLNSKTHMKIMVKWMRGRSMLKLFCNQVGSTKKFLLTTRPDEPLANQQNSSMDSKPKSEKPLTSKKAR